MLNVTITTIITKVWRKLWEVRDIYAHGFGGGDGFMGVIYPQTH